MKQTKKLQAFTLVEVLVYVAVLSIVGVAVTTVTILVFRLQTVVSDRAQLLADINIVTKSIRDDIYLADALSAQSNSLILTSENNEAERVEYYLAENGIFRSVNSGSAQLVTSESTNVVTFDVENESSTLESNVVRMHFVLENYPAGFPKPIATVDMYSTVTLKFER